MSAQQNRRYDRQVFKCKLRLYWQDVSGREIHAIAHAADLSEAGMCIVVPHRIEPRTYIQVRAEGHPELNGTASVRFCVSKGINYRVGLEFTAGVKLKA